MCCERIVLVYAYLYAYMCLSVSVWKCSQEAYIMWSTAKCSPNASDDLSRQLIKLECPEKIKARFERAADPVQAGTPRRRSNSVASPVGWRFGCSWSP